MTARSLEAYSNLSRKPAAKAKPEIKNIGTLYLFKRRPNAVERALRTAIISDLRVAQGAEQRRELMTQLLKLPLKAVDLKYAEPVARGRYTGEVLRKLGSLGGPREQARAKRRATAMKAAA